MSSKQLARTVLDGQKVTFETSGKEVCGYLCGMDDFHWMVITPDRVRHLIHKSGTNVTFSDEKTYESEPSHDELERVISHFRQKMGEMFFGRASGQEGDGQ